MNKIKGLLTICIAIILFSVQTVFAGFNDIENNSYEDEILFMSQLGILNGYTENVFSPEKEFTRAEFLLAGFR